MKSRQTLTPHPLAKHIQAHKSSWISLKFFSDMLEISNSFIINYPILQLPTPAWC